MTPYSWFNPLLNKEVVTVASGPFSTAASFWGRKDHLQKLIVFALGCISLFPHQEDSKSVTNETVQPVHTRAPLKLAARFTKPHLSHLRCCKF